MERKEAWLGGRRNSGAVRGAAEVEGDDRCVALRGEGVCLADDVAFGGSLCVAAAEGCTGAGACAGGAGDVSLASDSLRSLPAVGPFCAISGNGKPCESRDASTVARSPVCCPVLTPVVLGVRVPLAAAWRLTCEPGRERARTDGARDPGCEVFVDTVPLGCDAGVSGTPGKPVVFCVSRGSCPGEGAGRSDGDSTKGMAAAELLVRRMAGAVSPAWRAGGRIADPERLLPPAGVSSPLSHSASSPWSGPAGPAITSTSTSAFDPRFFGCGAADAALTWLSDDELGESANRGR